MWGNHEGHFNMKQRFKKTLFLAKSCCIFNNLLCKKMKPTHGRSREQMTRCFGPQNEWKEREREISQSTDGWKNRSCNRWTDISHGRYKHEDATGLKLSRNAQPHLHSYTALSDSIELQPFSQETGQSLIRLIPMSQSKQAFGLGLHTKNIIQNRTD